MYARIARFEGLDPSRIDDDIAEMKRQMDAGRSGELPEGAPEEARALMETVTRWVQLVDRKKGTRRSASPSADGRGRAAGG